jgi:hypothetical protein
MARIGDRKVARRVLMGDPRKRDCLEDVGVDGLIILKRISEQWDGEARTGII